MNYVNYNPFDPFKLKTLNKVFDDVAGRSISDFLDTSFVSSSPAINIAQTDEAYIIEVAAPGLKKEDFSVDVEKDHLIVSAKTTSEDDETEAYKRREFNYSSFSRKFYLSDDVARDKISATYKDGILFINLALKEIEKEVKRKVAVD